MNTTLNTQPVTITAKLIENGVNFPNTGDKTLHNKFRVKVTTNQGSASFDFYDSMHNYTKGITTLSDGELLSTLECFLSDAVAANDSFEGFCSNFGYDTDSRSAERVYKACQKSLKKAERIFADVTDTFNELN